MQNAQILQIDRRAGTIAWNQFGSTEFKNEHCLSNNRKQKNLTAIFEWYCDCSDNKDVRALIGRQQTEILRPDRLKNTDPLFRSSG